MNAAEVRSKILNEEDFVYSKRFGYSLSKVEDRYPDGAPIRLIATILLITEEEVLGHYERIVETLRGLMGVTT